MVSCIEYEYRLNEKWGIGAAAEQTPFADSDESADIAALTGHYHIDAWRFTAGLGYEWTDRHGRETVTRLEVAYDFEVSTFIVAPTLGVDFVDGETSTVLVLAFLKHF